MVVLVAHEIEGRGEIPVALVASAVGEAVALVDALGQHLAHEGLGVVHVLEAEGLHGIVKSAVVAEKVVDRFHVADVGQVVLASRAPPAAWPRSCSSERCQVGGDRCVAGESGQHNLASWSRGRAISEANARDWRLRLART